LDVISGDDGIVVGVAVDHRDALRTLLERRGLPGDDATVADLKLRILRTLAPLSTVVLVDVELGVGPALATGAVPGTTALAVPLEAQGYGRLDLVQETTFMEDWSPARARVLGAAACKLLLPYRVDEEAQAERQEAVAREAVAGCRAAGLALILEPVVYPRPDRPDDPDLRSTLIVDGARRLAALGPDVLKLQHPGSAAACRELDRACGPEVPWVLLGGGADAATLEQQVEEACAAGASGFIVGRTLFDGALVEDRAAADRALAETSRPLLERLAASARLLGTPWRRRLGAIAPPPPGWHRT
jgi:tagatose 1,6-diphosphate aldolase